LLSGLENQFNDRLTLLIEWGGFPFYIFSKSEVSFNETTANGCSFIQSIVRKSSARASHEKDLVYKDLFLLPQIGIEL